MMDVTYGRWARWSLLGRLEVWGVRLLGHRRARWSSLVRRSALLIVGLYRWRWVWSWWWLYRGGGCTVVVVVPVVLVSTVVVAAVFFLVATCRFKDTGWVSLFEAGKTRENGP